MTDDVRNSGANTEGRTPDGRFARGNRGKPPGSRHRATQAVRDLLDGQVEALTNAAVAKALEGDVAAIRLCLERLHPPIKDAPIEFELPEMTSAEDAAKAAAAILAAVSSAQISPDEGSRIMGLVETYRRTLEVTELEARIARLEARS